MDDSRNIVDIDFEDDESYDDISDILSNDGETEGDDLFDSDIDDSDLLGEEEDEENDSENDEESQDDALDIEIDEEDLEETEQDGDENQSEAPIIDNVDDELFEGFGEPEDIDDSDELTLENNENTDNTKVEAQKNTSTDNELDNLDILAGISEEDIAKMSPEEIDRLLEQTGINPSETEYEHIVPSNSPESMGEFEIESLENNSSKTVSLDADHDGTILNSDILMADSFDVVDKDADFISDTGQIVVMDDSEDNTSGENFRFQYINIDKIAIVKRIRKNTTNVEDLVQSIKSTGLLEPLVVAPTVTDDCYVLLAGFRRIIACAKAGKKRIPCIVNTKVNVPEIPVLEALYNHSKSYTIREIVDYISYLEEQKGIMSASMIEYLLQLNSGDYTKLKDILNDNDDDIVSKLFDGVYTIEAAFKKLEQRRKKESAEEKENKKAARVYEDEADSGAANIAGSGEEVDDGETLSEDEIKALAFSANDLDDVDNEDLQELVNEGDNIDGFQPNKQNYKDRQRLDPALRKAVLARDENTCQICKMISGQEYVENLDVHHIIEVYLGGDDSIDNLITSCTICHKLIHQYGRGELFIRPLEEFNEQEKAKFKRVIKLGTVIRKGMAAKGMKREQLKKIDNADTIGRTKPGTGQQAT